MSDEVSDEMMSPYAEYVERLTAERDRYKAALSWVAVNTEHEASRIMAEDALREPADSKLMVDLCPKLVEVNATGEVVHWMRCKLIRGHDRPCSF
jgi:hypothetical protein